MDDPFDADDVKAWLARAEREMFPKMRQSKIAMTFGDQTPTARLALEVGAAILFDKPLLVVALKGAEIPRMLRLVAAEVIEITDRSNAQMERVRRAIVALARKTT